MGKLLAAILLNSFVAVYVTSTSSLGLASFGSRSAESYRRQSNGSNAGGDNDGIHLAVSPQCGSLDGMTTNVNAGIAFTNIKTIVSFGVSMAMHISLLSILSSLCSSANTSLILHLLETEIKP